MACGSADRSAAVGARRDEGPVSWPGWLASRQSDSTASGRSRSDVPRSSDALVKWRPTRERIRTCWSRGCRGRRGSRGSRTADERSPPPDCGGIRRVGRRRVLPNRAGPVACWRRHMCWAEAVRSSSHRPGHQTLEAANRLLLRVVTVHDRHLRRGRDAKLEHRNRAFQCLVFCDAGLSTRIHRTLAARL